MNGNDILAVTMAGLEAGFKVSHIATFDLRTCTSDAKASEILSDPGLRDFDQIPVSTDDRIIGVLERKDGLEASVRKCMRPLDDSILVSAEQPLPKFLPNLESCPYRLVIQGSRINGIVTPSDIGKLPVRLMAFTLVTHLEVLIANSIRRQFPQDEDWFARLDTDLRKALKGKLGKRKRRNLHIALLDLTDFSDKIAIVCKLFKMPEGFQTDLNGIQKLRNSLDHARDFIEGDDGVKMFLERLRLVERWIEKFENRATIEMWALHEEVAPPLQAINKEVVRLK